MCVEEDFFACLDSGLNCNDVLTGRGKGSYNRSGNVQWRVAIEQMVVHSPTEEDLQKRISASRAVRFVRSRNPPGRFLRKKEDGRWYDIGDLNAIEKTLQVYRRYNRRLKSKTSKPLEVVSNKLELEPNRQEASKKNEPVEKAPVHQPLEKAPVPRQFPVPVANSQAVLHQPLANNLPARIQNQMCYAFLHAFGQPSTVVHQYYIIGGLPNLQVPVAVVPTTQAVAASPAVIAPTGAAGAPSAQYNQLHQQHQWR